MLKTANKVKPRQVQQPPPPVLIQEAAPTLSLKAFGRIFFALTTIVFLLETALIILTRYQSVAQGTNFFTERTLFTKISVTQISLIAAVALIIAVLAKRVEGSTTNTIVWVITGAFALFLAFDEWFEVHEWISKYSGGVYRWLHVPLNPSFWDAPLFLVYAGLALCLSVLIKKDIAAAPFARKCIMTAGGFLAVSVILDMGMHRKIPVAWEDGLKLLGFMFILMAFLAIAAYKMTLSRKS